MRRIILNSEIIKLSEDYFNNLFKGRQTDFEKPINENKRSGKLFELKDYLRNDIHNNNYADYIQSIIDKYDKIIKLQPNEFNRYYVTYFNLSENELKTMISPPNGNTKYKNKELYQLIVDAMRYDAVRNKEFIPYVRKLGIKSCVYCNAQFSITIEKDRGKYSGMYELDHYYPKSKYPFLATSFFNLQPCCSHCNKTKNDRLGEFNLYTKNFDLIDPFSFSLDKKSILRYLLTQNEKELEITFNSSNQDLKKNHEKLFHITELYIEHKDIVEEIIWKAKIYNKSYKENLSKSFSRLFPRTTNFNRFILGNYDSPTDIHKRPLAKLVQDIAKQLELI